jgi:hypothetical protein
LKITDTLKIKSLRQLWLGQFTSNVGDEIYKVAFTWLAVQTVGASTGFIHSSQLVVVFLVSLFGGRMLDHVSPFSAMIRVDLWRALIVMIPVGLFYLKLPTFGTLIMCSLFIGALGSFFDPSFHALLPMIAGDRKTLKGANGLMSTTFRLARVVGPMIVGGLSGIIAPIHFFTLDALTYLYSAWSVNQVRIQTGNRVMFAQELRTDSWFQALKAMWIRVRSEKRFFRILIAKGLSSGPWVVAYSLALPLLIDNEYPGDVTRFGLLMTSYGVGNILAALWVGSSERKNPERMVSLGLLWLGFGFFALAYVHSFVGMMVIAAITAVAGPLNDTPFHDLIQNHFQGREVAKLHRLRMAIDIGIQLAFTLIAPVCFRMSSPRTVLYGCGAITIVCGARIWKGR